MRRFLTKVSPAFGRDSGFGSVAGPRSFAYKPSAAETPVGNLGLRYTASLREYISASKTWYVKADVSVSGLSERVGKADAKRGSPFGWCALICAFSSLVELVLVSPCLRHLSCLSRCHLFGSRTTPSLMRKLNHWIRINIPAFTLTLFSGIPVSLPIAVENLCCTQSYRDL